MNWPTNVSTGERQRRRFGSWTGFWIPELRSFRQDARFQAFAMRLGWMDYWRQYGPPDECELKNNKLTCH